MIESLVIYAPNVGGGGGLVLLRELLQVDWPAARVTAILDHRGRGAIGEPDAAMNIHWVRSSLAGRWRAERLLARLADPRGLTLCFHNLPPILAARGTIFCYVQNANLVGLIPTSRLSGWLQIRYFIERFIARRFRHRIDRYIVQTPTMASALRDWYGSDAPPVDVLPFAPSSRETLCVEHERSVPGPGIGRRDGWDFIYVSDGSSHKNHRNLFAAWRLLAEQGIRPSLALTLHPERDRALREQVRKLSYEGLRIDDLGLLRHSEVLALYRRARALIFPSYAESFGVPLVEATDAGLPILAPELDYVHDICTPAFTFDAGSPRSISRAVRRFLGAPTDCIEVLTADQFAEQLSERMSAVTA